MTHYEILLSLSITGFEVVLCLLVYLRHLQRRLPLFVLYINTILVTSLVVSFSFRYFGFRSPTSYYISWVALGANLIARSSAIAELCSRRLQAYRGIWALAWRSLVLIGLVFLLHGAADAKGQPNWIAAYGLTIERDIEITSLVILIVMLLIGDYYRLPADSLEKYISFGFCFFCAVAVVNSTVLRDLFTKYMFSWTNMRPQVEHVNEMWNTIQVSASLVTLSVWCFALRKPIPEPSRAPVLLPAEVYQKLSPAVNLRLRAFNDRLQEMLKP